MKKVLILPILAILLLGLATAGSFDIQQNIYNNNQNIDLTFSFNNSDNLNLLGYSIVYDFNSSEVEPLFQNIPEDNIFNDYSVIPMTGSNGESVWIGQTFFPTTQSTNRSGILGILGFKRLTNNSITLTPQEYNVAVALTDGTYIDFENVITILAVEVQEINETITPNWVLQNFGECINFERKAYYKDTNNSGHQEPAPMVENCKIIKNLVPSVSEVKISPTKSFTFTVNSSSQVSVKEVTEQTNKIILNVSSSGIQEVHINILSIGKPNKVLVDGVSVTFYSIGDLIVFTTHFSEKIITLDYTPIVVPSSNSGGGSSGGSSSSSSSSSSASSATITISPSQLIRGIAKSLGILDVVHFSLSEPHTLQVDNIQDKKVTITIQSDPITITLGENENKYVCLNENLNDGIKIYVGSITNKATIHIQKADCQITPVINDTQPQNKILNPKIIITILVIVLIILLILSFIRPKIKKEDEIFQDFNNSEFGKLSNKSHFWGV